MQPYASVFLLLRISPSDTCAITRQPGLHRLTIWQSFFEDARFTLIQKRTRAELSVHDDAQLLDGVLRSRWFNLRRFSLWGIVAFIGRVASTSPDQSYAPSEALERPSDPNACGQQNEKRHDGFHGGGFRHLHMVLDAAVGVIRRH